MKIKIGILGLAMAAMMMTACEDTKKKAEEEKAQMEMQAEQEAAAAKEAQMEKERMEMEANSIAAKAMATESLSTLVTALQAADLATMMKEEGDYTVFAPTNDAFAKLPKGTLDNLLKPENKAGLAGILKYHVVSGEVMAGDLIEAINQSDDKQYVIKPVGGGEITAMLKGGNVMLKDGQGNTATVIQADVDASNGVVHVIDRVIMAKNK
ncbi:fasciclin domain-containing protein [Croceiramulus getboli]|nr:fasciclin domain-containing protein [Flavobacteriaceae bacterium YJPT1-3]